MKNKLNDIFARTIEILIGLLIIALGFGIAWLFLHFFDEKELNYGRKGGIMWWIFPILGLYFGISLIRGK